MRRILRLLFLMMAVISFGLLIAWIKNTTYDRFIPLGALIYWGVAAGGYDQGLGDRLGRPLNIRERGNSSVVGLLCSAVASGIGAMLRFFTGMEYRAFVLLTCILAVLLGLGVYRHALGEKRRWLRAPEDEGK